MKLRVRHTTAYQYGDTVALCHNLTHLRPRETPRQRCLEHELEITPTPTIVRHGEDFYGNSVSWFSLQETHRGLSVTAHSVVEVDPAVRPPADTPAWETAVVRPGQGGDDEARDFAFDSPYVPTDPALADYARRSFSPGRPLADAATDLMRRINREFKFVSGVTKVGTPILDVLRDRRGVCQDFTHLMIGMFRSTGLCARYVSGYLMTRPPPGGKKLVGADASHAWVSVWIPGFGWLDLDPTNDCLPGDAHVTLGWARDYGDIGPLRGIIVGGRQHALDVAVDVDPVDGRYD